MIQHHALAAGTRVGHYEIITLISVGGMGEVYHARDLTVKRDVAVKVLFPAFVNDAGRMLRFQREAEILASLKHPNIAQVFGVAESGDVRALAMEFVEGDAPEGRCRSTTPGASLRRSPRLWITRMTESFTAI